ILVRAIRGCRPQLGTTGPQPRHQFLNLSRPRPAQPTLVQHPGRGRPFAAYRLGRPVQVGQQMEEVEDADETPRPQGQLEKRPIVLLTIADVALAWGAVQPPPLNLGRHLPTECLAVDPTRHHRPYPLPRPVA